MPVLYRNGAFAVAKNYAITSNKNAIANANVFTSSTTIARVATTTDIYIAIGANVSATSNDAIIPAGHVEFFIVNGGIDQVSVLALTTAGYVSVSEMASTTF